MSHSSHKSFSREIITAQDRKKNSFSSQKRRKQHHIIYRFEVERVKGASYVKASNEIFAVTLGYESKSEKTTQHGLVQHEAKKKKKTPNFLFAKNGRILDKGKFKYLAYEKTFQ